MTVKMHMKNSHECNKPCFLCKVMKSHVFHVLLRLKEVNTTSAANYFKMLLPANMNVQLSYI